MNFNQLANLIKAGFNEEQIRSIGSIMDTGTSTNTGTNTGTNTPAPTTTALQTPPVTPAPTSDPATPPATTTPPAESGGTDKAGESETVTLLKEMLGMMQKGNINAVGTGAAAQETGVDVLAEILNPTPKTK